jgi:hypothetical protein
MAVGIMERQAKNLNEQELQNLLADLESMSDEQASNS